MPTVEDFETLQLRVGTVRRAETNEGARDPAFKLWIDFGELGEMQSSAKIVDRYQASQLPGRQIVAAVGLPPLLVGGFRPDVLVLGALTDQGVVLLNVDEPVPAGSRVA